VYFDYGVEFGLDFPPEMLIYILDSLFDVVVEFLLDEFILTLVVDGQLVLDEILDLALDLRLERVHVILLLPHIRDDDRFLDLKTELTRDLFMDVP
jgi:hypothetical protein